MIYVITWNEFWLSWTVEPYGYGSADAVLGEVVDVPPSVTGACKRLCHVPVEASDIHDALRQGAALINPDKEWRKDFGQI